MIKKNFPSGQILLIRALNATRPTYFPSYLGLRLIGSQMPVDDIGYLQRMVTRRLRAADSWRYRPFKLYKGSICKQGESEHEYRDCLAPTPSTAIAEAVILALMASDSAFKVPDRVFSYRWPKTLFSGGSYEYFVEGYKQRNTEITAALTEGKVAIVTDIKKFYPSVSAEQIKTVLKTRLTTDNSKLRGSAEEIMEFYSGLMNTGEQGIPIGPASGHVLGHLVLENVDKELTEKFGTNYFRYVDDIVVIANEADRRSVEKTVEASLWRYGFEPNADKTIALSRQSWERSVMRSDVISPDNFRAFTSDLTVYFAFHPDRSDELKAAFAANGLSIPVGKLLAISKYSRFRYFLRKRKAQAGMTHAVSILLSSNETFLLRALKLKHIYEESLVSLITEPHEKDPSLRRWQVQRIRRVVNILFYLRDFGEWTNKHYQLDEFPELIEQRALAKALSYGRVNSVLPFFGRGASAFSELWGEYGNGVAGFDEPKKGFTSAELESLITLQLYGTLNLSNVIVSEEIPQARMMGVAFYDCPKKRSIKDLSYEDELESLRLSVSNQKLSELARSRYSLTENTALDALSLMSSEYRS